MRLAAALALAAAFLAAAVYLHQRWTWSPATGLCAGHPYACARHHPGWEDPTAVLLGGLGIAAAALIAGPRGSRPRQPGGSG